MNKIKTLLLLLVGLALFVAGCGHAVSECAAVKIARGVMPARFHDVQAIVFSPQTLGQNVWRVMFASVDVAFSELGWPGDAAQYYKVPGDKPMLREMPEGVYANVVIYVDAQTGNITGRELNNGLILGYPDMYSKCR